MAVPAVYIKLMETYKELGWKPEEISNVQKRCSEHMRQLSIKYSRDYFSTSILFFKFRLFVSGSAALPDFIFEQWKELTGFEILEQYGMSGNGNVCFPNG